MGFQGSDSTQSKFQMQIKLRKPSISKLDILKVSLKYLYLDLISVNTIVLAFVKYSNTELMEIFAKMRLQESAAESPILNAPEHIKWSILRPIQN